jgi:hypothetical protein
VATDAARLQRLFAAAEGLFTQKNMPEAAGWAKDEASAADTPAKAAKNGSVDRQVPTVPRCLPSEKSGRQFLTQAK